jgi:hypothetical protein
LSRSMRRSASNTSLLPYTMYRSAARSLEGCQEWGQG